MKRQILFLLCSCSFLCALAQTSVTFVSQRPPELDVSQYRMVAIGDISGPLGTRTELSMDLADALSSRIFSAKTLELVDKGTLDKLLGDQKFRDLQVIDPKTAQELNKKLGNALLITGRLQSDNLEQKLIYQDQGIVVNGCTRTYYYQVKGTATIQLKIFELKTGKLIYNDAISKAVDKRTREDCSVPNKLDIGEIARQATKDLSEDIASLIVPYQVQTQLQFNEPGLLKSPFKKLREAVSLLQLKNYDAGLAILKGYTEDKDVKSKHVAPACYNYALGLIYAGQYDLAKQALERSVSLNSDYLPTVNKLVDLIEKEKQAAQKTARIAEERKKMEEQALAEASKPKQETKPSTPAKTATKTSAKPKAKGF